jgi:hypothetical protein
VLVEVSGGLMVTFHGGCVSFPGWILCVLLYLLL